MNKKVKKKNPLKLKACVVALSLWGLSAVLALSSSPVMAADTASHTAQEQVAITLKNKGIDLGNLHRYEEAIAAFTELGDYEDSIQKLEECENILSYADAIFLLDAEQYEEALAFFTTLGNYKDSAKKKVECENGIAYNSAVDFIANGNYENAYNILVKLGDYKDAAEMLTHFKEIEITIDNWNKYFSVIEVPEYDINGFGEVENWWLQPYFSMNEDVKAYIYNSDKCNLALDISFMHKEMLVNYNKTNGNEYELNDCNWGSSGMKDNRVITWTLDNDPIYFGIGPCYVSFGDEMAYQLAQDFTTTRAEGTIYIYE